MNRSYASAATAKVTRRIYAISRSRPGGGGQRHSYCDSAMGRRRRHAVTRGGLMALALLATLAGYALAAPPGAPPKPAGVPGAPPPAWIEAGTVEKWLAYSTYCWKVGCADYISPEMRKDLPVLRIRRGQTVTVHLGFVPSQLSVSQASKTRRLVPRKTATWRPAAGVASIFAVAEGWRRRQLRRSLQASRNGPHAAAPDVAGAANPRPSQSRRPKAASPSGKRSGRGTQGTRRSSRCGGLGG